MSTAVVSSETEQALVDELVRLRHGWGLLRNGLRGRIGPELTRRCGIADADSDREIRVKIAAWLRDVGQELPPESTVAARVALALAKGYEHPQLGERIRVLAEAKRLSSRTIRRRMDHALRLIAQAAPRNVAKMQEPSALPVVRLEGDPRTPPDDQAVVLRVAVPRDHFELLIIFDVEVPTRG